MSLASTDRLGGPSYWAHQGGHATTRARKKTININIFGGTVSGTNGTRPRDKMGPLPGTKWDPSLGQTSQTLFNSTVKSPFCPVCPWDGWGFVPGTIVPQGLSEKCLCVLCLLVFFAPKTTLKPLTTLHKDYEMSDVLKGPKPQNGSKVGQK